MVISSLIVTVEEGKASEAQAAVEALAGVEVHEEKNCQLVVTIEAETLDESAAIAESFSSLPGVLLTSLVYVNFEDDPSISIPAN